MAPEVISSTYGMPSSKSDVYSYVMVILEKVGARKKENFGDSQEFPGYLFENLDSFCCTVTGETSSDSTEIVKKIVKIALWCIQIKPAERPSTSKLLEMLESQTVEINLPPKPEF